jgi:hypothetical protein
MASRTPKGLIAYRSNLSSICLIVDITEVRITTLQICIKVNVSYLIPLSGARRGTGHIKATWYTYSSRKNNKFQQAQNYLSISNLKKSISCLSTTESATAVKPRGKSSSRIELTSFAIVILARYFWWHLHLEPDCSVSHVTGTRQGGLLINCQKAEHPAHEGETQDLYLSWWFVNSILFYYYHYWT